MLKKTKLSALFENLLLSFNLRLGVTEPTRLCSNTCIDNIIHNVKGGKAEVIELALSDHTAQILKCPVKKTSVLAHWYIKRRDFSRENMTKFMDCLKSLNFNEVYMANSPNEAFDHFANLFELFYNLCFPFRIIKMNSIAKPKWITSGIRKCCKRKRDLLWKCRTYPNSNNKIYFKQYSKRLKNIISQTQKSQNDYYIKNSVNKSKAAWNIINNPKTKHPKESISQIVSDGKLITNPSEIAKEFNNYFIDQIYSINNHNISNNFNSDINNTKLNNPNRKSFLTCNLPNSLFMHPTNSEDIEIIINALKNTSSTGYDGICTKVIKEVSHIIAPLISHIVNLCIEHGSFPDKLKIAVVKPLYKKDDKQNMSNYRPVALISVFSKVIEKVIYNSLYGFFERHDLLVKEQNGFRKNKSINKAIFDLMQVALTQMNKRVPVSALYMDMTKAFDFVDHNILLSKLYAYGVRGNAYNLIKSYLSNRKQMTQISKLCIKSKTEKIYSSDFREIRYGVPQGSVLGPLLFLIYINDLPKVIDQPVVLFADDCTVLFTGKSLTDCEVNINRTLNTIIEWLTNNNLNINISKTKVMSFRQRRNESFNLNIAYKGKTICETDMTKFLGLNVDNKLAWNNQIEIVCKKLNKYSYALYNLRKVVNVSTVLTAYHAYVTSTLRYGIIFWGNATRWAMAFKAQKKCIRSLCGLRKTDSCKSHFKNLKILTLPCLYIYEICVFVRTNMDLFMNYNSVRLRHKLCFMKTKTALLKKSVLGMAPKIYNKLPRAMHDIDNLYEFKKKLNIFLAEKAYYSIREFLEYT